MTDILKTYELRSEKVRKQLAESHTETSLDAKESGVIHGTWQFENQMSSVSWQMGLKRKHIPSLYSFIHLLTHSVTHFLSSKSGVLAINISVSLYEYLKGSKGYWISNS